jgi:hypothetical protein
MAEELGYLQLCADRRFHHLTMKAFEGATGLEPEQYWIEARSGGAPAYADRTRAARFAYREGATHFGWAAHGDGCRGFHGESNAEMRRRLERTVRARMDDFPRATHYELFGEGEGVLVTRR